MPHTRVANVHEFVMHVRWRSATLHTSRVMAEGVASSDVAIAECRLNNPVQNAGQVSISRLSGFNVQDCQVAILTKKI
eukprot:3887762-Pleurochrysis_carterae.AAC.1